MRKNLQIAAVVAVFATSSGASELAADTGSATDWIKGYHTAVRLVAGGADTNKPGLILAGIQMQMDPGWKTYWRNPGDAGVPPRITWKASRNVSEIKILYPAPHRFADPYGVSLGYKKEVVFPLLIKPTHADRPVSLDIMFEYAVCEQICVPGTAKFALNLDAKAGRTSTPYRSSIEHYLGTVPVRYEPDTKRLPKVRSAELKTDGKKPYALVEAAFVEGAKDVDLFVEGKKEWYIPPPKHLGGQSVQRFRVDLSHLPKNAKLDGTPFTFTLVSSKGQSEQVMPLK